MVPDAPRTFVLADCHGYPELIINEAIPGAPAHRAGALAAHLSYALIVSYHSDDFDGAQDARPSLAAGDALCAVLRRTAGDLRDHLAGVDPSCRGCSTQASPDSIPHGVRSGCATSTGSGHCQP